MNSKGLELAKVLSYYGLLYDSSYTSFKIVCPFHADINPSMMIDLDKGFYFCFGCNVFGDAKDFVKRMSGKNDLQALKLFHKILKTDKTNPVDLSNRVKADRVSDKQAYVEAYDFYYGLKTIDWNDDNEYINPVKKYMEKRGFVPQTLNKCRAKLTYQDNYPIVFPMFDNGRFKGWVCRTTDKRVERKRKYLYNTGFSRATTLVGDYDSKTELFMVEGYMDRLKFIQYGERNVVAILGWKITREQIEKLKKKGVKRIISALDDDESGRKGTIELSKHFDVVRWKYMNGVKDPGDMTEERFDKMLFETLRRR